jgi:hypothetical protein
LLAAVLVVPFPSSVLADTDERELRRSREKIESLAEFTFVRVSYDSEGGWSEAFYDYDGRVWQRWETDYPEADKNFLIRLEELTTCAANPEPIVRKLTDDDLFRFPMLYMCDVGWMKLTAEEKRGLREYLLRGGFLWVDDFWGVAEWNNLVANLSGALPEYQWQDIRPDHPIMNVVFPLKECPQVPAKDFAERNMAWDPPGIHRHPAGGDAGVNQVNFKGITDKDGRLLVVATHNTDLGDGFEREGTEEWFFQTYSTKAYAMGINIVVYALTH